MRSYSYSSIKTNSLKIEYKHNGELLRNILIKVGNVYKIDPDNKLKTTNRGRVCTVMNFIKDDINNPIQVKVKYHDTLRNGKVDLTDLVDNVE